MKPCEPTICTLIPTAPDLFLFYYNRNSCAYQLVNMPNNSLRLSILEIPADLAHSIRKLSKGAEMSGFCRVRTATTNVRNKTKGLIIITSANVCL